MRSIPIGMTALALLSAAASAQTPQTAPSRSNTMMPGQSATAIPVKPAPAINPLNQEDVSWIAGTTVNGGDDAKVGHVSAVLMDPKTKKIDRLVVAVGGFLGIASHRVAIPVDQFSWNGERAIFKLSKTTDSLKALPEWVEDGTTGTSQRSGTASATTKPASAGDGDSDSPSH